MKYILIVGVIALVIFYFAKTAMNKKIAVENVAAGEEFLKANKAKDGVFETPTGLQYQVIKKGTGTVNPSANSTVEVHYHGSLLDGSVFDSSVERGESISFPLDRVIKGWTEGVQLMVEGDKYKFFIPSHLAYGNSATGKITPGSLLVFEVALLKIQ